LIRSGSLKTAIESLEKAYRLGPENPRLGYVYGVALENAGQRDRAIEVWGAVVESHPNDQATLNVLTMTLYQAGEHERALAHAEHLAELSPDDPARQQIVNIIRQELTRSR